MGYKLSGIASVTNVSDIKDCGSGQVLQRSFSSAIILFDRDEGKDLKFGGAI